MLCGRQAEAFHHVLFRSSGMEASLLHSARNIASLCTGCHTEAHDHGKTFKPKLLELLYDRYGYDYSMKPFCEYVSS